MKILLDIKDNIAAFIMELLRNFKFVKVKPITEEGAKLAEDIRQAVEELNLIKEGKLEARNAEELINEL